MERVLITLLVACAGGIVGMKLKIPAGAMIGAMIAVAAYHIWCGKGEIPANFKIAAQIIVGGMLGLNFSMDTLYGLKEMALPAIVMLIGLMVLSVILGIVVAKTTGMDLITALFSSAPGGITEMTLASEAYGADTPKVAILHLMRLISVITILPIVIKSVLKWMIS